MINSAVSRAILETQLRTLENFQKFVADVQKDHTSVQLIADLISNYRLTLLNKDTKNDALECEEPVEVRKKKCRDKARPHKKRSPSAYILFIKHKIQLLKTSNPEIRSGKNLMIKAVEAWSALSEEQKSSLKTSLKANENISAEELYNLST